MNVLLCIEEVTEFEDYVIKKIVDKDVPLNLSWTLVQVLILFVHSKEAVLRPVVGEVIVDLANEFLVERPVGESCEQGHPVVEFGALVLVAHSLVVILDDFDERTHDLRKEDDSEEDEDDTDEHLSDRYREIVTVSYCREGGQSVVAGNDALSGVVLVTILTLPQMILGNFTLFGQPFFTRLLKLFNTFFLVTSRGHRKVALFHVNLIEIPVALEGVIQVNVFIRVDQLDHPPPEAADLVGYDESDQNQSNDFVSVHRDLL